MSLAAVRDLREVGAGAGPEELVDFETDVLAGFVLARAAAPGIDGATRHRSSTSGPDAISVTRGGPLPRARPLHLASVFGLDQKTAIRYAASARQLIETAAEQHVAPTPTVPANPRANLGPDADGPLGSG